MPIRLALAEDSYLVREGVRMLIESQPELELIGVCGDLEALLTLVAERSPDVVVTDIRMPPTQTDEGIRAAERLRETDPDIGVVVLSQYAEAEYALKLLEHGSERRAYLLKERVSDLGELLRTIEEVAGGGSVIDPKIVETLVAARAARRDSPLAALTDREREVLAEMAQGKNNAAIAGSLVLTERAIEKHINSIFSKLGLSTESDTHRRVRAVLLYLSDQSQTEQTE